MFISVVIPLYNKENRIRTTIQSILNQTHSDFEIIVVNDGSSDRSREIVEQMDDVRIRLINQANGGPSSARNRGILEAKAEWLTFLDADDLMETNALEHFSRLIEAHPTIRMFSCNFYYSTPCGKKLHSLHYKDGIIKNNFRAWFWGELMPCQGSTIYNRQMLLNHPYDESLRRYEDAHMLFDIMREEFIYRSHIPTFSYILSENEASKARPTIKQDFLGHLEIKKDASLWERLVLYELYQQAVKLYPQEVYKLYGRHFVNSNTILTYYLFKTFIRCRSLIDKLFYK